MIGIRLSDTTRRASGWVQVRNVGELRPALADCWADYRLQQGPAYLAQSKDWNQYRQHMEAECSNDERERRFVKWRAAGHPETELPGMWRNYVTDRRVRIAYALNRNPDAVMPERLAVQVQPVNPSGPALSPWNDVMPVWITAGLDISRDTPAVFRTRQTVARSVVDLWAGIVIAHEHDENIAAFAEFVGDALCRTMPAPDARPHLTVIDGGN